MSGYMVGKKIVAPRVESEITSLKIGLMEKGKVLGGILGALLGGYVALRLLK